MLKKLLLFFICINFANAIQIVDDISFQNIYKQKQNINKTVLMIYTAKTCPQCAYMKKKVFKDTDVKKFMDKHIVVLEKNINTDELPKGFEYFGIPTMFFIDKNGTQISKIIGSSRAQPFLKQLKNIIGEKQ